MAKKDFYRFSIKLNEKLPKHVAVAQILNDVGKGAMSQIIVDSVWECMCSGTEKGKQPEKNITATLNETDIKNLMDSFEMFTK